jgi:hypothetical protein
MVSNGSKNQLADPYIMTERPSLSQFARELKKLTNPHAISSSLQPAGQLQIMRGSCILGNPKKG